MAWVPLEAVASRGVVPCRFLRRLGRVLALVEHEGRVEKAVVANTGRLEGVLEAAREGLCSPTGGDRAPLRLLAVLLDESWAIVDTVLQERVLEYAIVSELIPWLSGCRLRGRKPRVGSLFLDFVLDCGEREAFVEAKSALALIGDSAAYPDAPTLRGLRHIETLGELAERGFRAVLVLVASHPRARRAGFYCSRFPLVVPAVRRACERGAELRGVNMYLDSSGRLVWVDPSLPAIPECVG